MKNRSVSLCLLTATLFAAPAFAEGVPPEKAPPSPVPNQAGRPTRDEMIKRFDQDGDGQLNEAERQKGREEMRRKWADKAGPRGPGGEGMRKMQQRHDRNGDGQLDETERREARKAMKKMRHRMEPRMMRRQWSQMHRGHSFAGRDRHQGFRGH